MVVDDDPDIRFVVMSLLSLEFEATQACNGLDALEKIERYEPDLLLMDVNMPVMNGIACCSAIKQSPNFEHLPVIFLSASAEPATRDSAMAAGAVAFFGKPFKTSDLIEAIQGHFTANQIEPTEKLFSVVEIEQIDEAPLGALGGWNFSSTAGDDTSTAAAAAEPVALNETVSDAEPGTKRRVFGRQRPKPAEAAPPPPEPEKIPVEIPLPSPPPPDYKRVSRQYVQKLEERQARESRAVERLKHEAHDAPVPPPAPRHPSPDSDDALRRTSPAVPRFSSEGTDPVFRPKSPSPEEMDAHLRGTSPGVPRFSQEPPPPTRPASHAAPAAPEPPPPSFRPQAPPPVRPQPVAPPQPAVAKGPTAADVMAARKRQLLAKAGVKVDGPGKSNVALKPRILVICDYAGQLEVCNEALRGMAEFLPLEDPVEAIALIARFQPDMVIASIVEKKYSGLQIAQMLKSNRRLEHIEMIFVQNAYCEPALVNRAMQITGNQVLRVPLNTDRIRSAVTEILRKPGFQVREKAVPYGMYVTEVIRAAENERAKQRKHLEKQSFEDQFHSLASFMAKELKEYKEPVGYDELKGIGAKSHRVGES
jgi:CheY-like chemotaxis protein